MKKLICMFLALLMVAGLWSCGGKGDDTSKADASSAEVESTDAASEDAPSSEDETTEDETADESEPTPAIPVINGSSVEKFTIVYVKNTDPATYKAVALALQSYIKDTFGFELAVVDEYAEEAEKEIIVGHSTRRSICTENDGTFGYGGYKLVISGTKVLVEADYATGAYQGIEALGEMIRTSADGIFDDMELSGEGKVIKVACVGDSITQGINSTNPNTQTYPCYLQTLLGLDYYVMNAGLTDRSICSTDPLNYGSTLQHTFALELAPDVLIFNLGINDANPSHDYKNWTGTDRGTVFVDSANKLLDDYIGVNGDVQIFLCLPSSLFVVGEDKWKAEAWTENITEHVHPLLSQIAADRKLATVDFFDWSVENAEVFVDGLHPKDESYGIYAKYLYDCIKDSIKRP